MRERDITKLIDKAIAAHGGWVWKYRPVPGVFGARVIDYLICAYGDFIGIEAKRPGKGASKLQQYHGDQIRKAGGAFLTISTVEDVEWFKECLISRRKERGLPDL